MKANEFFKKHGWNDTKVMIESPFGLGEYEYLWDDLKRLVESYELVERFGGLFQAKITLDKESFSGGIECDGCLFSDQDLERAIADVESCTEAGKRLEVK